MKEPGRDDDPGHTQDRSQQKQSDVATVDVWWLGGWVMRAMRRGFRCLWKDSRADTCIALLRPLLPHGSPSKQGTSERMQMPMSHLVSLVCVVFCFFFRIVCVALRHKNTTRLAYKHCCSKPHKHHHPPLSFTPSFLLLLT